MTAMNTEIRLSAYYDGELPDEEIEDVRAELDREPVARQKRDGLSHLSRLIGMRLEELAGEVDSDALFASIKARIAEDIQDDDPMFPLAVPEERPALRVVKGGGLDAAVQAQGSAAPTADPPSGRGVWLGVVGLGLAAAAVLGLLYMRPVPTVDVAPEEEPGPAIAEMPQLGSEVEEVDFGYSTGAIFAVEGEEGEPIAVVWISDEKFEDTALDDGLPNDTEEGQERVQ